MIDIRTFRLPNILTFSLLALGLVWAFITSIDFYWHLLGAAVGYGAFWAIEVVYRLIRGRDGLGRGDAKLLSAGGAWCGVYALPAIVLIASLSAIATILIQRRDTRSKLAFGPYLCFAISLVWIGQQFI